MEIEKAIKESSNRRLQTKYKNAVYVIQRTFALYEFEQVAFSFNGGKDSTVLLHLIRAGYYLHKENSGDTCLDSKCPIRTIYFESPAAFPEINSFTYETAAIYELQLETIRSDFKSGLEALLKEKPIKAIFMGTRFGDPNAVGQEQFSPSSVGWPPFMRVNPILDWSYRDVWAFILTCKLKYCSLYDQGYTSIGSIYDTLPNSLLTITDSSGGKENFKPAYMLSDGRLERAGRARKISLNSETTPIFGNGLEIVAQNGTLTGTLTASIIVVGDEILFGIAQENMGPILCKKLHAIGWQVTHVAIVRNDIDSVAEEVEQLKSTNDMVFLLGGFGSLHSDVSLAGVAKAFGVRLAPNKEFEEYLSHLTGDHFSGYQNEMALLPEGITELLQHEKLPLPLVKCRNVVILSATNASELETQWKCLLELPCTSLVQLTPFTMKQLSTKHSDAETAQTISKLSMEFPDIYIGCCRTSRTGPLIVNVIGKDKTRTEAAAAKLCNSFNAGVFSELTSG